MGHPTQAEMREGRAVKRVLDVAMAGLSLVVLAPLLAILAALVRWRLGRPVLFTQARSGRHGAPFRIVKFRSMTDDHDTDGRPLPDSERLTSFGRALRRTSLDELPELINVLKGDMSLVGPRPLPVEYLDRYTDRERRRHEVRPGLTGWAQVNGRNSMSWNDRLEADVWYVDNRSLRLDVTILARTLRHVVTGRGVNAPGAATMHALDSAERRMAT